MLNTEPIIFSIVHAALSYNTEDDEVSVIPTEVLESNVVWIRDELKELKADFKEHKREFSAAIARLDHDIKSATLELRSEIHTMAAKAASDLKDFAGRVEYQLRELRVEHIDLRDRMDRNHAELTGRIE